MNGKMPAIKYNSIHAHPSEAHSAIRLRDWVQTRAAKGRRRALARNDRATRQRERTQFRNATGRAQRNEAAQAVAHQEHGRFGRMASAHERRKVDEIVAHDLATRDEAGHILGRRVKARETVADVVDAIDGPALGGPSATDCMVAQRVFVQAVRNQNDASHGDAARGRRQPADNVCFARQSGRCGKGRIELLAKVDAGWRHKLRAPLRRFDGRTGRGTHDCNAQWRFQCDN